MEYKFVPALCQGEDKKFEGYFTIKLLPYPERLKMSQQIGISVKNGEAVMPENQIDLASKMVDLAVPYIKDCKIKRLEDGYEYESLEEVMVCSDAAGLIQDVCGAIINGVRLGKN